MAGKVCPNCKKRTFYLTTGNDRKCSSCGYEMILPRNKGVGGKGKRCSNCGKYTVFNNVCVNCKSINKYKYISDN